jgi:glycosyltransferase involved in cell wall biosynthesis
MADSRPGTFLHGISRRNGEIDCCAKGSGLVVTPRKVLNITKRDAIGRRFNNLDAAGEIAKNGWDSSFCTWSDPESGLDSVFRAETKIGRRLATFAHQWEYRTGQLDRYYRNSPAIRRLPVYDTADLLHYHIVHEGWLSAADWIRIAAKKPVVWTWHDPYLMTGHCIYPLDCKGFRSGCQTCSHLNYQFPVARDKTRQNLRRKAKAVQTINPLVIVASEYMANMIRQSVYGDTLRVRVVPFGVEWPLDQERDAARSALGIPAGNIVIGFRAVYSDYKGLPLIQEAIAQLSILYKGAPITVIAFQEQGTLRNCGTDWTLLEPGWIADETIGQYYAAMDFFLMPSRAEAFGMMAIEALAAGALPIVTYGTALPELVDAPVCGMACEHSREGLTAALLSAIRNANHWNEGREKRRSFAKTRYSLQTFASRLAAAYDEQYEYHTDHRRSP